MYRVLMAELLQNYNGKSLCYYLEMDYGVLHSTFVVVFGLTPSAKWSQIFGS